MKETVGAISSRKEKGKGTGNTQQERATDTTQDRATRADGGTLDAVVSHREGRGAGVVVRGGRRCNHLSQPTKKEIEPTAEQA